MCRARKIHSQYADTANRFELQTHNNVPLFVVLQGILFLILIRLILTERYFTKNTKNNSNFKGGNIILDFI